MTHPPDFTFTCVSFSCSEAAISIRRARVKYRLKWNSFSSSYGKKRRKDFLWSLNLSILLLIAYWWNLFDQHWLYYSSSVHSMQSHRPVLRHDCNCNQSVFLQINMCRDKCWHLFGCLTTSGRVLRQGKTDKRERADSAEFLLFEQPSDMIDSFPVTKSESLRYRRNSIDHVSWREKFNDWSSKQNASCSSIYWTPVLSSQREISDWKTILIIILRFLSDGIDFRTKEQSSFLSLSLSLVGCACSDEIQGNNWWNDFNQDYPSQHMLINCFTLSYLLFSLVCVWFASICISLR